MSYYPCKNTNAIGECTLGSCSLDPSCPNNKHTGFSPRETKVATSFIKGQSNQFLGGTYQTQSNHYYILIVSKLPSYITPEGKYYPNCFAGIVLDSGLVGVWSNSGDCLTPKIIVGSDGHLDLKSRVEQRPY